MAEYGFGDVVNAIRDLERTVGELTGMLRSYDVPTMQASLGEHGNAIATYRNTLEQHENRLKAHQRTLDDHTDRLTRLQVNSQARALMKSWVFWALAALGGVLTGLGKLAIEYLVKH